MPIVYPWNPGVEKPPSQALEALKQLSFKPGLINPHKLVGSKEPPTKEIK